MSQRTSNRSPAKDTNLDDWETDPDFVRDMDEMDQRWGNKRTVGSINMNELIEEVRRDHKTMRDKYQHPSQLRDYSQSEFGERYRGNNPTSGDGPEKLSKHSTKEISREYIRSSESSSYIKETNNGSVLSETVREKAPPEMKSFMGTTTTTSTTAPRRSPIPPKPDFSDLASRLSNRIPTEPKRQDRADTVIITDPPGQFKDIANSKRIFHEEKKSSSSSSTQDHKSPGSSNNMPQAFKSIQDKIDAFKKEFDDIEHKVAKKSDISELIKKTTNVEKKSDNVQYVSRSNEKLSSSGKGSPIRQPPMSTRPTSASPLHDDNKPRESIKSMSERFEMLNRESSEDFKRRMEERRKEFFDRIKTQVRETRKGLDGFDIEDSDDDERVGSTGPMGGIKQFATKLNASSSPIYGPQSTRLSADSLNSQRPKVYTKRETTQEEVISTVIKENDKIVHDETKRNVERTSSCHGSSDEESNDLQPSSIKSIDRELRKSPQQRMQSPIDEIKRKIPVVKPEVKGAGLMARTLYDYTAAEADELSFDVDDLITNIEKIHQGWYKGTITKDGVKRVGLFPANYVKLLNDLGEY